MKPQDRRNLVCLRLVLLTVLFAGSARGAPLGTIAEERLEPSQLVLQPFFEFERAALTVEGPAGYVDERAFRPGEAIRLALADSEGEALPDGRYRYSLSLTPGPASSSDVQNGLFYVHESSGLSRAERRDQLDSIREILNQERESQLQEHQRDAPISPDKEEMTVAPPSSDARLWCQRRWCCGCDGDFNLGGSVLKEGKPFLHNYGGSDWINTALGVNALVNVVPGGCYDCFLWGAANTAVGQEALYTNSLGQENTAVGASALYSNVFGSANTAVGLLALHTNNGDDNTALGWLALVANTTGDRNTASGIAALGSNTSGFFNTASGAHALTHNTTGHRNTTSGAGALYHNSTGYRNTASGGAALYHNTTGSRNVAVGQRAGLEATTGSDNIFLGSGAEGVAGEANTIRIGGTTGSDDYQQNRAFIAGIRGITTEHTDAVTVVIDSGGQLGTISSSRYGKEEIRDMDEASGRLLDLRPVTFRHRQQESVTGEKPLSYGLIAEEVAAVFPELVVFDKEGKPEAVLYRLLTPMLLNELQKQARLNQEQQVEIERLRSVERELVAIKARLADLEAVEEPTLRVAAGRHPPPESGSP